MKPIAQIAYEAYYGPLFKYAHTDADKKRRFGKVARAVAKAARRRR